MRCIQVSPTSNTMHDRRQTRATQVSHFVSVRVYGEGLRVFRTEKRPRFGRVRRRKNQRLN